MSEERDTEESELTEEQREELRTALARAASVLRFVFGGILDGLPAEVDAELAEHVIREDD